ncbi:MAG TPA: acetyl-CoA carboxylase biotin carboxyl carrier protein [Solirubrobacterales bacterium]|jgi:acetyl-CoA carboxylase biotin carboxyl carrier protein|nr:acetyl-CoA carboxylase biotin carboxyl carrier protein [Solirubrobacterales bacterium]
MEMSPETIKALLDAFDGSDWREMVVTVGEDRLHVSRDPLPEGAALAPPPAPAASPPAAPASASATPPPAASEPAAPAPAAAPVAAEIPDDHTAIESPSVGLFWRAPAPGAAPFVEVGAKVAAGETVAIVEVMKLMNHVASPVDGVVSAILVENGAPVEFGQPIVVVDPQG